MAAATIPHNPLDILPVPASTVFCKACSTVHTTRVQLCPAARLDICGIHKTVLLPHEKSIYAYSHLQDVDTECASCMFGSEKKLTRALSRSNSRALRPAPTHKDVVFCVYCWGPATKKCDHLASCREHSTLYLRSQIDINSKWWLRPSDFACYFCPINGVMPKKAQEWKKIPATSPDPGFLGGTADDWDLWRVTIESQITRLSPGAFPNWQARCEYVAWLDGLGSNEMLYLRYLAYEGVYPITIIYAETGTFPGSIRYPPSAAQQAAALEPPPPYVMPQATDENRTKQTPAPAPALAFRNGMTPIPEASPALMTSVQPMGSAMPTSANQLTRTIPFMGPGRRLGDYSTGGIDYQNNQTPRPSYIQSMHSRGHQSQGSQVRPPQVQTHHPKRPSILSQAGHEPLGLGMAPISVSSNPLQGVHSHHGVIPSQVNQRRPYQPPVIPPARPVEQLQDPFAQLHAGLTQLAISENGPLPPLIETPQQRMQSQLPQGHQYHQTVNPPVTQPQSFPRRVSFAAHSTHESQASQYQIPTIPATTQYTQSSQIPAHSAPRAPPQPTHNIAMANYMAQLRAARAPPTSSGHNPTPSTLPGSFPVGYPADDDDWETVTEFSEDDRYSVSAMSVRPESMFGGLSYQGVPQQTPVQYPAFQPAFVQNGSMNGMGGQQNWERRISHPFAPT